MTQLAALVVEDEPPARRYLVELLRATGAIGRLVAVATAGAASEALDREPRFDVAFVDIRLIDRPGDTTGLDWVCAVAATPAAPRFVLTTAMAEHAIAAFEAGAVDYLLKPFTRQRVAACVQRLVERRAPPHAALPTAALPTAALPTAALPTAALPTAALPTALRTAALPTAALPTAAMASAALPSAALPIRLVARNAASLVLLPLDGILAFEASERLTYVHHLEGRFLVDPSLSALEAQFGELVLRTHRNWLAARRHVRRLDRASNELCLVVGDSLEVPVSRDRAAAVRKELLAGTLGLLR